MYNACSVAQGKTGYKSNFNSITVGFDSINYMKVWDLFPATKHFIHILTTIGQLFYYSYTINGNWFSPYAPPIHTLVELSNKETL